MASSFASAHNLDAIDDAYQRWRQNPASVDPTWQAFFEGFELAGRPQPPGECADAARQSGVVALIDSYRDLGHFLAHLDPLTPPPTSHPLLELSEFGFTNADLDAPFTGLPFQGLRNGTLRELLAALRETYCRTIGVEYLHIQDTKIRRWLEERMEVPRNRPNLPHERKMRVLRGLHYAELFEKFLQNRYQGQKRFSLEGAETLIPLLDALIEKAADLGAAEIVLGMPHRGRLNVLANTLHKPYQEIFTEFEDVYLPELTTDGDGDVKYHLGFSSDYVTPKGQEIHLSLSPNPSHLEAVNPVVEGRTRAKQTMFGDTDRKRGIPLLIHGDAAFAGQGLVAETLNLSNLPGYKTGGTVHVVVNNQIGFTTSPADARSTTYCTDVAKMIQAPVFHVNAEDPEANVFVAELAMEFRQQFNRDVVIDMYCYRRYGHNETDDPSVTAPLLYANIKGRPTAAQVYTEQLVRERELTREQADAIDAEFQGKLDDAQKEVRSTPPKRRGMKGFEDRWEKLHNRYSHTPVATGVPLETLARLTERVTAVPDGFHLHATIRRLLDERRGVVSARRPVNWSFAETLAFGSLLLEGTGVRLSGQDSRRGTFSQRHTVMFDTQTNALHVPLNHLSDRQATFQVYDSMLSEAAVLGFEFGYSLDDPQTLVLWEAQFGDFVNGAQVIIDQFLVSSESKWQRASGLVLLLPHGYEGQGPEHSSARLERFLQSCAEDNLQVCNLTTPAQYFHLLRRQMRRPFRKPLVLMTPKSLLRHPLAVSPLEELTTGSFREVIDDAKADPNRVRRVLLCSGKVYYDLFYKPTAEPDKRHRHIPSDVAVVRVEQFYPFPEEPLRGVLSRYRRAKEIVWVQEESHNMGGWHFMEPRLRCLGVEPSCVSRDASASTATGSHHVHEHEQEELVEAALHGEVPHLVRASPALVRRHRPAEGTPVAAAGS
jgi:2-oxoglutarate dehydrogenase E1 component